MEDIYDFSVLLSVYAGDNANYYKRALYSVTNQTLLPSEIVIVNDGPLSESLYEVQNNFIKQCAIKCVVYPIPKNVGLGEALRRGLEQCNYCWVARMDSDDISRSNRFELQMEFLTKHPDAALIGGFIEEFDEETTRLRKVPIDDYGIQKRISWRNPFNHVTVMMNRSKVMSVGSYRSCEYFEDYYLWARMLNAGFKLYNMPVVLVDVRVGSDMIGRRHGWIYVRSEWNILKKLYKLNIVKSDTGFLLRLILKSIPRLVPKAILAVIYKRVLR